MTGDLAGAARPRNTVDRTRAQIARELEDEIEALPVRTTAAIRAVRRRYSRSLRAAEPGFVMGVARALRVSGRVHRGVADELISDHASAARSLGIAELEALGTGMASWDEVDSFGLSVAGPAWLRSQIADDDVAAWARSPDRWWRRAALVSTVALNLRSRGGQGDAGKTLRICSMLIDDRDDMVVKAMSWALRALAARDPEAVRRYVEEHRERLAARAIRETGNKLRTGLKTPRRPAEGRGG